MCVASALQCAHCFKGLNHRNKCKPKSFGLTPNGFSALKISCQRSKSVGSCFMHNGTRTELEHTKK